MLRGITRRPWWPWTLRIATAAFLALVAWLLVRQARTVDWAAVWRTMLGLPAPVLLAAGGLALCSHLLYASFDLFGRRASGHRLSVPTTLGITLVSYPFTLNLGSLIGGVATRYRLYSRHGLDHGQIGQIVGTSMLTNWVGYFVLAGIAFWLWTPRLPEGWQVGPAQLHAAGVALAAVSAGYLALCALRRAPLSVRGHEFPLPTWPLALLQIALSALNWALMSGMVWLLLQRQAPYPAVLATMLFGAVAGLVSRVPAGLGVLEAVAVGLLAATAPRDAVLAAILAYRALYYFAPLVLAALAFAAIELRWRKANPPDAGGRPGSEGADGARHCAAPAPAPGARRVGAA
ncbi:MAG: lysylphosphatidylglycerol synthase domain-containing protein [Xylophilus ampelinus]